MNKINLQICIKYPAIFHFHHHSTLFPIIQIAHDSLIAFLISFLKLLRHSTTQIESKTFQFTQNLHFANSSCALSPSMLLRVCMYTLHNGGNELNLQYCANFVERTNECVYTVHMENIRNSKVGMQKSF